MIRTLVHGNVNFVFWFIFALVLSMPFIEDKLNIMMPYETWVERGMPGWGTAGWTHGKMKSDRKTPQAVEQTFPMNGCLIDNDQVDKDESYYKNWLKSEVKQSCFGKGTVHIIKKERGNGGKNSDWFGGLIECAA